MKKLTLIVIAILAMPLAFAEEEKSKTRVIYPKHSKVNLDDLKLEGEMKAPGDFYFQFKPDEKFDSLVKRRKNFHRQMLRDAVLIK